MKPPKVSIVIPTYNRPDSTEKTVYSALNQKYANFEVIVVDDGSEDDTWKRVSKINDPNLKIFRHNTNKGGNAARNTGIKKSSGKYIAFLDSDDTWDPMKLDEQIKILQETDVEAVYCDIKHTFDNKFGSLKYEVGKRLFDTSNEKPEGGSELVSQVLATHFPLGGSSTLVVNKEFLQEIGMFDENFKRHQDWELLVRILQNGEIRFLNKELVQKHDTGSPGYDVYFPEKVKFLNKYSNIIIQEELQGKNIIGEHHFGLAKFAVQDQKYKIAYQHFKRSRISDMRRVLFLIQSFFKGIREKNNNE